VRNIYEALVVESFMGVVLLGIIFIPLALAIVVVFNKLGRWK
jgi:hypothetical protein